MKIELGKYVVGVYPVCLDNKAPAYRKSLVVVRDDCHL
jgi:hypothetical protein